MSHTHLRYTVIMEKNEDGGYTVTVPSLPGCISEGSTWDEALAEIEEAISGYIEVAKKSGRPIPVEVTVPVNTVNAYI
ncbi:MAG: type II toxin-antitoxin system HicB family antitoxin [Euryarchaeota archaeon]|nr:type II toxin-antitoxin system HicB family antitoxin [Euryarchaeota archaeon]